MTHEDIKDDEIHDGLDDFRVINDIDTAYTEAGLVLAGTCPFCNLISIINSDVEDDLKKEVCEHFSGLSSDKKSFYFEEK